MLVMASLNMSLLKMNRMSLWVASSNAQGRTCCSVFTFTSPPSTVSTWMKHKILLMIKCVILLKTSRTSKIIRLNTFTSASWSPSTSIKVYFPECDTKFSRSLQLFLVLSLNFFSKFLMAASAVDGLAKLFWPDSPWKQWKTAKK